MSDFNFHEYYYGRNPLNAPKATLREGVKDYYSETKADLERRGWEGWLEKLEDLKAKGDEVSIIKMHNRLKRANEQTLSEEEFDDKGYEYAFNLVNRLRREIFPKLNDEELASFGGYLVRELGLDAYM